MSKRKIDPEKAAKTAGKALDVAEEVVEHRGLIVRIVRLLAKLIGGR
jgi:hypothetical protein